MEIFYKVYKPQSWGGKKKKERKEKTLIIFVYQVQILALTKPSSILVGTKLQRLWVCF